MNTTSINSTNSLASLGQEGLLSIEYYENTESSFNTLFSTRITGPLSQLNLKSFFNNFVNRHKILRSKFKSESGNLYLWPEIENSLFYREMDISSYSDNNIKKLINDLYLKKYNFEEGPLFKVYILQKTDNEAILIICAHHTVNDGISTQIFLDELYTFIKTSSLNFNSPKVSYEEFAKWQHSFIKSKTGKQQLEYWTAKLKGNIHKLNFSFYKNNYSKYSGNIFQFELNEELSSKIKQFTLDKKISLFSFFMSIYQILLFKYTGLKVITIGHPTAGRLRCVEGRKRSDFNDNVGYFVNPNLYLGIINPEIKILDLFIYTNNQLKEDSKHQDFPFNKLYNILDLRKNDFYAPQVIINFQKKRNDHRDLSSLKFKTKESNSFTVNNFTFSPYYIPQQLGTFDLEWEILESDQIIFNNLKYRNQIFKEDQISRMSKYLINIINFILQNPEKNLNSIDILTFKEKLHILKQFNSNTKKPLKTAHELIFKISPKNKNKIAVKSNNRDISYRELDHISNIIIEKYFKLNINKDLKTALIFTSSAEMISSLIASIKLGIIFIPIDATLPKERIKFILHDSKPNIILTNISEYSNLHNAHFIDLNHIKKRSLESDQFNLSNITYFPSKPAYIIYTSGSTGRPKGTVITYGGLVNMLEAVEKEINFSSNDNMLQLASYSFDASICEIFLALKNSATLTLIDKENAHKTQNFINFIENENITTAIIPPALLNNLNNYKFNTIKKLITGGESPIHEDAIFHSKYLNYYNVYGPSETSVITSIYKVNTHDDINRIIPIGKPIQNIHYRILDENCNLCPIGIPGEICISGIGVGLGYLNQPELTKEKFIKDPFLPDTPMYKTGDLGKWDENGNVIFLGRIDNQVKINGYRIELGEIESRLLEIVDIEDVLVTTHKDGESTIIISFIKTLQKYSKNEIKDKLSKFLPYYMIPSEIVFLNEFPLNNSGKKDKTKLIELFKENLNSYEKSNQDLYNNSIIETVKDIWEEVLSKRSENENSNFFDEGGNSLQVAELKNCITRTTGINIDITDLFKYTTIKAQAKVLLEKSFKLDNKHDKTFNPNTVILRKSKDIAVIGMAGKFPGAENVDELWKNLIEGKESISTFSDEELLDSGVSFELLSNKEYIRSKGIINDADMFDAEFFGYSPRDAELIDPQQRVFLECSYNALQDAGYSPDKYSGKIGVFASSSHNSYLTNNILTKHDLYGKDFHSILTGNEKDFIATRVAYKLNLKGPAQTIQTACSSSLVGIHYACESIINGSSDIAMAGGVSITLPLKSGYHYTTEGIGSPDGHCRPFDNSSGGTVPGNGVAIVVLKNLEEALHDGDHIYAIIKGSAINNDGSDKIGFTAPSVTGQEEVVKNALLNANITPEMISYIETHGTGTRLGDPIEIRALTNTFGKSQEQYCSIGSIKANIGHLDAAAGVAGFIKTVLTLYNNQIPPNINFSEPNPEINFDNTPFYVNKDLINWPNNSTPKFAGVSSLGLGGTNAHVVLQSPPENYITKEKTDFAYKFNKKRYWIEPSAKPEFNSPKRQSKPKDWLYAPIWKPTVLSNKNYLSELESHKSTWLLFKDENHIGDEIIRQLEKANNTVIIVSFRKSYNELNRNYSINPYNKDDYDKLFLSLNKHNLLPNHIIHLPLITKDRLKSLNENNLKPISYLGFFSLLFTVKSLQHINYHNCKISVISDHVFSVNGEDWINPLKSTIIGPINVIPQEHPGITCQHIDISLNTRSDHKNQISEYIIHDLINFQKEQTIAYRNHRRWIKSYERLNIEPGDINLKNGNTYLITGGLGGIGLKAALSIASTHNVTFVLSGKNVLPPEDRWDHILNKYEGTNDPLLKKIKKIKKIRSLGSKVITLCIDIQNRVEFSKSLENIEKHHGKINGVIHAAGTSGNQLISTKTIEDVEQVFDPKVRGTLYLQSYFSHHKLDFFILFSSLSSISGGIEQVAYSSANAFLDAVAAHNFSDRHLQTLAINWPGWKDTGMILKMKNYENIKHLQNLEISNIITDKEGLETLKLCLSLGPVHRLIVSPLDFNDWRMSINKNLEKEVLDIKNTINHDRPNLPTDLLLPQNREEREMATIWENILHISQIGTNDNFFDLGGHSLLGLELLAQIAKIKKCPLQLNDLYDHPTVSSIVKLIRQRNLLNPFAEFKLKRNTNKSTNLIVPLNNCKGTKAIYLFQPAGVNIYYYQQLAETISDDICIYGVRLTDLEEGHNIETSIEKIAERCTENIINHSNQNIFNLAGSSFGGVVAYEVAQQLKNKNREINILSLFDSPGPNHLPVEPKDDAEILHRIFSQWISLSLSTLKQAKTFNNQCRYIMGQVEQESETGLLITPDQIQLLLSISKNSIIALNNYKPKIYRGDLLFIKPLDFHPNYDRNPERAWHDLVDGKFIIKNVPGDHLSMNIQPNVYHIGKIISQELI